MSSISYNIKVPGDASYKMHQLYVNIADEDLPPKYRGCNWHERQIVAQFFLLRQGLLFQEAVGEITKEAFVKLNEQLKDSYIGVLYKKIQDEVNNRPDSSSVEDVEGGDQ